MVERDKVRSDARLMLRAMNRRWPTTDTVKAKLINRVEDRLSDPLLGDDALSSLGRVILMAESQNQADDHLAEKNDRLDTGKPTERVSIDDERRAAARKMLAHPDLRTALIAAAEREAGSENLPPPA
jgi:hypothetical protein